MDVTAGVCRKIASLFARKFLVRQAHKKLDCNEIGAVHCFDFTLFKTGLLLFVFFFAAPTKIGLRRMRLCLKLRLGRCPKNLLRALPRDPGRRFALHPTSVAPLDPRLRCASFWFECGFFHFVAFPLKSPFTLLRAQCNCLFLSDPILGLLYKVTP